MTQKLSLKVIRENEDVIGAFVADGHKVICSCLPTNFSESQIDIAIDICNKSILQTRVDNFSTDRIVYYLQNSILIVKHVVDHVFLFVLCKPINDLPLLDIYINIMDDEILNYLEQGEGNVDIPTLEEIKTGDLGSFIEEIRLWLINVLGPISSMVLDDAIEDWIAQGTPDEKHIEALFAILDEDLSSEDQVKIRSEFAISS